MSTIAHPSGPRARTPNDLRCNYPARRQVSVVARIASRRFPRRAGRGNATPNCPTVTCAAPPLRHPNNASASPRLLCGFGEYKVIAMEWKAQLSLPGANQWRTRTRTNRCYFKRMNRTQIRQRIDHRHKRRTRLAAHDVYGVQTTPAIR